MVLTWLPGCSSLLPVHLGSPMKILQFSAVASLAGLVAFPSLAPAQEAVTDPVGVVTVEIPRSSDTFIATPLSLPPVFSGEIQTVSIQNGSSATFQPSSNPGWNENELVPASYVLIKSGELEGMFYDVLSNSSNSVTVLTDGDDLSVLTAGVRFEVVPHWTLNRLFVAGSASNPLTPSASTSPLTRRSQVFIYDNAVDGINKAPTATYFFTNSGWFQAGSNTPSNDVILPPASGFLVRQPSSVPTDVSLIISGRVLLSPLSVLIPSSASNSRDTMIGLMRPVPVRLDQLGLESAFVQSSSTSPLARRDVLMVFSNSIRGSNKGPVATYYMQNGNWLQSGTNAESNGVLIQPGEVLRIRKFRADGLDSLWVNNLVINPVN
jgi:uncharacterized protein (TIGR02597 family)